MKEIYESKYNDFLYRRYKNGVEIFHYTGDDLNLIIPEFIDDLPVVKIGRSHKGGAFEFKNIESVILPKQLREIGQRAFYMNKIKKVTIPESVEIIGGDSFRNNLINRLNLSNGLKKIGVSAFENNLLKQISIPKSVDSIDFGAFAENEIEVIKFPENGSLTRIKPRVFSFNNLYNLELPKNIKSVGVDAFSDNNLKTIYLKHKLEKMNFSAFNNNDEVELLIIGESISSTVVDWNCKPKFKNIYLNHQVDIDELLEFLKKNNLGNSYYEVERNALNNLSRMKVAFG